VRSRSLFLWLLLGSLFASACGDDTVPDDVGDDTGTTGVTAGATTTTVSTSMSTSGIDPTSSTGDDTQTSDDDGTDGDTDGDTGEPMEPQVIECPDHPLTLPATGTCEVTRVGQGGTVLRGTVLAPDTVLRGGEVYHDDEGVIVCVDCDCSSAPGALDATEITCADAVISPGLINPHDHITFARNAPIGEGVARYDHRHEWRLGLNGHQALSVPGGSSADVVRGAELRFIMSGTTAAASAGGQPGLMRNLDRANMLDGLPVQVANTDTFPLNDSSGIMREMGCNYGNSPTTAEQIAGLDGYLPHISEGINQAARNELHCTSQGQTDVIERQTAVVHAVAIEAQDVLLISDEMARVVWSPRSNIVLYGNTAPVTMLDSMGVMLALGTDWVASGSMNMLRELRCAAELNADYFDGHFDDRALWQMATTNATFATGTHQVIGMLKPGYVADIAVFAAEGKVDHQAVIDAELTDVVLVMRGGDVLYGDDALLASSGVDRGHCEELDVCGVAKRACVAADLGNTDLASVRAAIEAYYPLFFCGVPDDEPSCVPWRDEYADGISMVDSDGDGVPDATDNCPTVFNPVRPLELGQGDADGDGIGDACDPCPLDANDSCMISSADDIDGDTWLNGTDNCPFVYNPDQADADGDGHGDVCDACPFPNPGNSPCPITVDVLQNENHPDHLPEGSQVLVHDVYVTAVRNGAGAQGFYVQHDTLEPYTGIFVYTNQQVPSVEIGDHVSVSGVYIEYFGLAQIVDPVVALQDAGPLPFGPIHFADPSELATSSATAEQWESMLVEVGPVSITVQNADAPSDYDEFEVTGGLRVDDLIFDNVVGQGLGNTCPVGSQFTRLTGIEGYSFNHYKLMPRDEGDIDWVDCNPVQ
jgi:cytosine/adenosine deaminase-related metal-dependent hydrolase